MDFSESESIDINRKKYLTGRGFLWAVNLFAVCTGIRSLVEGFRINFTGHADYISDLAALRIISYCLMMGLFTIYAVCPAKSKRLMALPFFLSMAFYQACLLPDFWNYAYEVQFYFRVSLLVLSLILAVFTPLIPSIRVFCALRAAAEKEKTDIPYRKSKKRPIASFLAVGGILCILSVLISVVPVVLNAPGSKDYVVRFYNQEFADIIRRELAIPQNGEIWRSDLDVIQYVGIYDSYNMTGQPTLNIAIARNFDIENEEYAPNYAADRWNRYKWYNLQGESQEVTLYQMSESMKNLKDLRHFANLKGLSCTGAFNCEPLGYLSGLKAICLSYNGAFNTAPLLALTEVEYVCYQMVLQGEFSSLGNMKNLREVGAMAYGGSIEPLAELHNLEAVNIYIGSGVDSAEPLRNLTNLRILQLYATDVEDVSPLSGLSNLEVLNLEHTKCSDVSPLAGLEKLEDLYLYSTQVKDTASLDHLEGLRIHQYS